MVSYCSGTAPPECAGEDLPKDVPDQQPVGYMGPLEVFLTRVVQVHGAVQSKPVMLLGLLCFDQVPPLGCMSKRAAPHNECLQDPAVSLEQWAHGGDQGTALAHLDDRQGWLC